MGDRVVGKISHHRHAKSIVVFVLVFLGLC